MEYLISINDAIQNRLQGTVLNKSNNRYARFNYAYQDQLYGTIIASTQYAMYAFGVEYEISRATKLAFIGVDDHSMSIEVSVSNLYVIIDFGNQYSHSLLLMGGALIYYSSYQYYN